jgi:hypothetical protein
MARMPATQRVAEQKVRQKKLRNTAREKLRPSRDDIARVLSRLTCISSDYLEWSPDCISVLDLFAALRNCCPICSGSHRVNWWPQAFVLAPNQRTYCKPRTCPFCVFSPLLHLTESILVSCESQIRIGQFHDVLAFQISPVSTPGDLTLGGPIDRQFDLSVYVAN